MGLTVGDEGETDARRRLSSCAPPNFNLNAEDANFLAPELQIALSFIIELSIEHQVRRDPAALRRSPSGEWP